MGPNGAGKTTAMRLLLGLLAPDAGEVRLLGGSLGAAGLELLRQVGSFIEGPALYDHRSGRANLAMACRLLGLPDSEVERVLELVDMRQDAHRPVRDYSLGMRQRIAFARSLLGRPKLLLLDEPTNGLDPDGIADIRLLIRELPSRMDCTIFVSSHLLGEVEQVADTVGLLRRGTLVMQGPLRDLLGSGRRIVLEVGDPARAAALAGGFDRRVQGGDADTLFIALRPRDDAAALCAAVNRALVQAGIPVFTIKIERLTLEELYRQSADAVENERTAA
ncbi:ABC transporter ATP-binding protein [Aurantiacibacter gangjinensis]|nr:ABC transporter ATP-binding protein [Aurantiacibacter gangjinensis]